MGKVQTSMLALMALAVGVGVFMLTRKGGAESLGRGAVNVADGIFSGVVKGAGSLVGVPDTDAARCDAALAAGDSWAVSFYCPAAKFIGHIFTPEPAVQQQHDAYTIAGQSEWTAWDQDDADMGVVYRQQAFAETTGGAVTGLIRGR